MEAKPPARDLVEVLAVIWRHPRQRDWAGCWLSRRTGVCREKVDVYIHRCGNGCHWGQWKRTNGDTWPDISAVAQELSHWNTPELVEELLGRLWQEWPREAKRMRLPAPARTNSRSPTGRARWEEVREQAERHCSAHPFPGVRALAGIVGCAPATMSKAIRKSPKLAARLAEQTAARRARSVPLTEVTMESTEQRTEPDPNQQALDDLIAEQETDAAAEKRGRTWCPK